MTEQSATESEVNEAQEAAQEQAPTLREALQNAFDAQEEDSTEEAEEELQEASDEVDSDEESQDKKDEAEELEYELAAPTSWNKKEKELFESLTTEQKEIIAKHDKSRTADYTRKTQELAEQKKEVKGLIDLLTPYKDNFKQMGVKAEDYVNNLMHWDSMLAKDPEGTILQLADKFNIDLAKRTTDDKDSDDYDDEYASDTEKRLLTELRETKEKLSRFEKSVESIESDKQAQEQTKEVTRLIQEFTNEVDDDGELLHPHINNEDVIKEMQESVANGKTLAEAYYTSKTVRKLEREALLGADKEEDDEAKQRQDIAKAKRAGKRVKTSSARDIDFTGMSIREELSAKLNQANSGRL